MSTKTIGALSPVTTPAITDELAVEQGGITRRETLSQVQTLLKATDAQTVAATSISVFVAPSNIEALKASSAQVSAGTATTCFVTPSSLGGRTATSTATGLIELLIDSEAIAGTDNGRALTAANLKAVMQGLGYAVNMAKGTSITAAGTTAISAATGNYLEITGNTDITSFSTGITGMRRTLNFTGTPALVYNATSMILPSGGTNITMAGGDVADMVSLGGSNWKCVGMEKINGTAISAAGGFSSTYAQGYRNAALSVNDISITKVPIDAVTANGNPGGNMDIITNGRYNVPSAGYYLVNAKILFAAAMGTLGDESKVYIYIDGVAIRVYGRYLVANDTGGQIVSVIQYCTAGQYIELYAYQNNTANTARSLEVGSVDYTLLEVIRLL